MNGWIAKLCFMARKYTPSRFGDSLKRLIISHVNFVLTKNINGVKVKLPVINAIGFANYHPHEEKLDWLLKHLLKRPGAIVDVGVNIGQTLIKIKTLNPDDLYIGFEPNPDCCAYLNKLVNENSFGNTVIIPAGLYSEPAILDFYLADSDTASSATLVTGFRSQSYYDNSKVRKITVFNGDYCLDAVGVDRIATIKIDVEGGELEVVKGLISAIKRDMPYIICEILPAFSNDCGRSRFKVRRQEELCGILKGLGYRLYRYSHHGVSSVDIIGIHSDLSLCDYCFVPEAEHEQFEEQAGLLNPACE